MTRVSSSLWDEFRPPVGLRGPHIQSVLGGLPLRSRVIRCAAGRFVKGSTARILEGSEARLLCLVSRPLQAARGMVVLLHGWEGCAESGYMLSAGRRLAEAGYVVVRLNFRDHGGTHALNEELFHSCRIDEVVEAVGLLQQSEPSLSLCLLGFSLGGNFALRVAVRAADAGIELRRVVAVCPVLSPVDTMRALEEGAWVYRDYFLRRWRRSLQAKARAFPHLYSFGDLRRLRTLTETTDFFVRRYTAFGTLDRYLDGYAITGDALARLQVPSLLIATRDDPVIPIRDLDRIASSPALDIAVLPHGGHCGLLQDYSLRSWLVRRLDALLSEPAGRG